MTVGEDRPVESFQYRGNNRRGTDVVQLPLRYRRREHRIERKGLGRLVRIGLRVLARDATCAERFRQSGPNGLKIGNETTHRLLS